ncbi:MAG: N-6 DNA methylase [Chloroflexi bacterium]|nr:N-6 DNA methylase [Chloroflexota bacterium]
MQPLEKSLRNRLERTVTDARTIAETAAKAALDQLGVGEATPFPHLSEAERELRRKLRVHGRQLGDILNGGKVRTMDRLIEEVAYEHWHRMLFARFLAENNLLMYPDLTSPVAVTLEECEDLAAEGGAANGWELASQFAACMLPQIFRPDSPVFQLTLPPEYEQKLERLVGELPAEVFKASDSLGWVYQFWQAKKKDEVNASEVKIGARELPVVTQLFTEPYMVSFLLDNSLGAWWAARRLTKNDLATAQSEEELRQKASLPSVPLEYLRFVKDEDGVWTPAAGTFDDWPEHLSKLKTLDPCCGSGHFLVAALLMLVPMRMELEGLSAKDAVDAVLRDNLHGLEIDQRCVELAAFALAFAAWRYPGAGRYRQLPELNIACSGLAISAKKEEWLALAGDNINLQYALDELYNQFKDAPVLGSLINPEIGIGKGSLLFEMKWAELYPLLTKALSGEKDDEKTEMGVIAQGIAKAADLLAESYFLILTNVPYLTRSKQNKVLMDYCDREHASSKNELGYVFVDKFINSMMTSGCVAVVQPQNMLYMARYKAFRKQMLQKTKLRIVARLGARAFETISGEVVNVGLFLFEKNAKLCENIIQGMDVSAYNTSVEKADLLKEIAISRVKQKSVFESPDCVFSFDATNNSEKLLGKYAECYQGIRTGDANRFVRNVWEVGSDCSGWELFQTSSDNTSGFFSGYTDVILWEKGSGVLHEYASSNRDRLHDMHESGNRSWTKMGVAVGQITIRPTGYFGEKYDNPLAVLTPIKEEHLAPLICYLTGESYAKAVKEINRGLYVTNAALLKVPFDLDRWTKVAQEKYPNGLPKPYSDDPTQWIFHGHPAQSDAPLQVAVARLLGYRWPAELDPMMELSDEARAWVQKSETLLSFADEDGIVCIPPVRGEMNAEDRLENLLAAAYGSVWSSSKRSELLDQADHAGKTLETWLREMFFTQHCKLFHHRPFIWHIWDGLRDGFAALVNYHKLDYKLLETLIYTYLGDWISRQKQDRDNGVDGAEEKLAAAETLKKHLEMILKGDAPYDIFVRWKPLEKQPIGWNPDLNDGVRLNIRPFVSVPDVKKKGAGVLRDKPNVKWGKDRGTDVESAPWYTLGLQYGGKEGDRINDHHLSLAKKLAAKENGQKENKA